MIWESLSQYLGEARIDHNKQQIQRCDLDMWFKMWPTDLRSVWTPQTGSIARLVGQSHAQQSESGTLNQDRRAQIY